MLFSFLSNTLSVYLLSVCGLGGEVGPGISEGELCLAARILVEGWGKVSSRAAVQKVVVQFMSVSLVLLLKSALSWVDGHESGAFLAQFPPRGEAGHVDFPWSLGIYIIIYSALLSQGSLPYVLSAAQQVGVTSLLFSVLLFSVLRFIKLGCHFGGTLEERGNKSCRHATMFTQK